MAKTLTLSFVDEKARDAFVGWYLDVAGEEHFIDYCVEQETPPAFWHYGGDSWPWLDSPEADDWTISVEPEAIEDPLEADEAGEA